MGWEMRRGSLYYYQKRRVNGKVVSTLHRAGPHAEAIAAEDEQARAECAAAEVELAALKVAWAAEDRALTDFHEATAALTTATRLLNGYHMHKGQWRKGRYEWRIYQ